MPIIQALTTDALLRMEICRTLVALFIFVWIDILLNHVSATRIPNPSFDLLADSFNASEFDSPISNLTSLGAIDPAFGFVPIF